MYKILICNNVDFHYDIIESVIMKYDEILKIKKNNSDILDLFMVSDNNQNSPNLNYAQLKDYLLKTYNINFIDSIDYNSYDYQIHCTASATEAPETDGGIRPIDMVDDSKYAYIAHDVTNELLRFSNVYFLSKFNRDDIANDRVFTVDTFPKFEYIENSVPSFIILGSFIRSKFDKTRDYSILEDMLSIDYKSDFIINIVGSWHEPHFDIWSFINKDKIHDSNINKINIILNAEWNYFNRLCSGADYIIPLVSKQNQPHCFKTKVTSSIFYGIGYKKTMFVDQDFVDAYSLSGNQYFLYSRKSINTDFSRLLSTHPNLTV